MAVTLAGNKAQAVRPVGVTQTVAVAGTSAATTNAVAATTQIIRVMSTTDCFITVGTTPTATTTHPYLPAYFVEYFRVEPGTDKVAAIQVSGAGTLYVSECS